MFLRYNPEWNFKEETTNFTNKKRGYFHRFHTVSCKIKYTSRNLRNSIVYSSRNKLFLLYVKAHSAVLIPLQVPCFWMKPIRIKNSFLLRMFVSNVSLFLFAFIAPLSFAHPLLWRHETFFFFLIFKQHLTPWAEATYKLFPPGL
jgi:hypothetical protein